MDLGAQIHHMADQPAVPLHHEIQLRDKGGIVPEDVQDIMLQTSGAVHVPKGLARQLFRFAVVVFRFQTDGVILVHRGYLLKIVAWQ